MYLNNHYFSHHSFNFSILSCKIAGIFIIYYGFMLSTVSVEHITETSQCPGLDDGVTKDPDNPTQILLIPYGVFGALSVSTEVLTTIE